VVRKPYGKGSFEMEREAILTAIPDKEMKSFFNKL
jgi:hypothetical protein